MYKQFNRIYNHNLYIRNLKRVLIWILIKDISPTLSSYNLFLMVHIEPLAWYNFIIAQFVLKNVKVCCYKVWNCIMVKFQNVPFTNGEQLLAYLQRWLNVLPLLKNMYLTTTDLLLILNGTPLRTTRFTTTRSVSSGSRDPTATKSNRSEMRK